MTSTSSDEGQKPELSLSSQEAFSMDYVMAKVYYLKSNQHIYWVIQNLGTMLPIAEDMRKILIPSEGFPHYPKVECSYETFHMPNGIKQRSDRH